MSSFSRAKKALFLFLSRNMPKRGTTNKHVEATETPWQLEEADLISALDKAEKLRKERNKEKKQQKRMEQEADAAVVSPAIFGTEQKKGFTCKIVAGWTSIELQACDKKDEYKFKVCLR